MKWADKSPAPDLSELYRDVYVAAVGPVHRHLHARRSSPMPNPDPTRDLRHAAQPTHCKVIHDRRD
jgi:hypothetical protein